MSQFFQSERWDGGYAYEHYMGRWSRLVAQEFLPSLGIGRNQVWLDVGCGTGALTDLILATCYPRQVVGIDLSHGLVGFAASQIRDEQAQFGQANAIYLPFSTASFDVVVSAIALNFMPDQARAIEEMKRVTRPGGTIALYVWDYAGKMEWLRYFWDAAVALDEPARVVDEGQRFPICQPQSLQALFESAKLRDVDVSHIDVPTAFPNFAAYWEPFSHGQFPAPAYLKTLAKDQQNALRDNIWDRLPIGDDGTIELIARVWTVRGEC